MTHFPQGKYQVTPAQMHEITSLLLAERSLVIRYIYLLFLAITILVITGQYYFVQRAVIQPILQLGHRIQEIGERGSLAQRVPLSGDKEFTDFAHALNRMLARLELAQQRAQQYRTVVEKSISAVVLVHPVTRRLVDANAAFQQMTGYTQADTQDLTIYDLLPLSRLEIDGWFAAVMERPQEQERDLQYRRKNGESIAVEVTIIYLEGGENALYAVAARDISMRKQIQQALVATIPDNYVRMKADGTYVDVHLSGDPPLPYSAEELIGRNIQEFLPPETTKLILEVTQRTLATRQIESFEYEREFGGNRYYMDARHLASGKDEVVALIRNVTKQRQTEEIMRYQASLVDNVSDAIISTDLNMFIISWNQAAQKIYGFSFEEVRGKRFRDVVRYEYVGAVHGQATEALQQKGAWQGEQIHHHRDGAPIYMWVSLSYIYDHKGKPLSVVGVNRNITEQKSSERLLLLAQQSESLRVMAGGIAHDFNNLLTSVLAQNTLALRKLPPDSKAATHIGKAVKATERAADLTRQLLAYTGQGAFLLEMLNLNQLIQDNLGIIETVIPKHIQLQLTLAPMLSVIKIDRGHAQQAMMNLILNGIEAIQAENGWLQLTTGEQWLTPKEAIHLFGADQLTPGQYSFLRVTDNGKGLDTATIGRIFEPYFTTKQNGSGLGLAATLGIVQRYRGGLAVESQAGHGTTFTLFFPAAEQQTTLIDQPHQTDSGSNGLVLVVDDEAPVREALNDLLSGEGHTVLLARDGYDGLDKFQRHQHQIDLIFLDMKMPGMNGAQTLAAMRALNATVPVILCSGYSEAETLAALDGLDITAFLTKPFEIPKLFATVKNALMNSSHKHADIHAMLDKLF